MSDQSLLSQVRELRERGLSQKQIARELGIRPAAVAPMLRHLAGTGRTAKVERPLPDPAERDLVGCWINPGWSAGLGLEKVPEWAASDPDGAGGPASGGLIGIMVARADRSSRVTVCGYLVDVYCLGVKNAVGPRTLGSGAVTDYVRMFFSGFGCSPKSTPLDLAQHLVHGGVDYARSLGFEPHPDFVAASVYLGPAPGQCPIGFGRNGSPYYISGPNDDPRAVLETLNATAGKGKYQFLTHL